MSFSVGTMIVVAVAMLGSLTVLPAVLSKLGDRVEKGRIPFVRRLRGASAKRSMWGAITERVLRRPVLSALAAGAVLVALALPTLQLHTDADRHGRHHDARRRAVQAPDQGLPGQGRSGSGGHQGRRRQRPLRCRRRSPSSSSRRSPAARCTARSTSRSNADGTVARVDIPLAGNGVNSRSTHALATLRHDAAAADRGPGRRRRVRRDRHDGELAGLQRRPDQVHAAGLRLRPAVRLRPPARDLPLDRDRGQGDPAQPALRRCGVRRAGCDLPVGLGRGSARIPVQRRHRELAPDVHVRDPVRPLDGLPRVHPEPDPRGPRSRPVHRQGDLARHQVHGRARSRAPRS